MNLTKPSEYLYLSWSKVSGEGKSLRPAYLVADMRRLFPGIRTVDEDMRGLSEREITRSTGLRLTAEGIRDRRLGLDGQWKELYGWFAGDKKSSEDISRILRAGFLKKEYPRLGEKKAKELYPEPSRVSVTRLEAFSSCAYAHFLSYGLRLSDREEYEFKALDLGNIAHQSLERFSRKADRERISWPDMSEEKRNSLIEESVEESVADYGNTVLYSSARNEYMVERIKRLMRRSVWALTKQLEKGDFIPSGYELKFGSGKIDRVDICEDGECVYVKVTDYKTGMKNFDITAFYHGLQMQLPVYLNAALEEEKRKFRDKKLIPAGIFYYRIQDPVVARKDSEEEVEQSILRELRLDGLVNGDGEVLAHLERDLLGTSVLFPVGRNKDGSLSKNSRAISGETFGAVLEYAGKKESQIKKEMYSGEVSAAPYELGDATGCDYCAYRDICGFDSRIEGCGYRRLEKFSMEEAIEKMVKEGKQDERKLDR